jgi:hypothetical protein
VRIHRKYIVSAPLQLLVEVLVDHEVWRRISRVTCGRLHRQEPLAVGGDVVIPLKGRAFKPCVVT